MQENSAEKCSLGKRLERLRVTLQTNWSEIAAQLELSESMVYQVKSGKKELSDKAIYRLEQAEKEAGITPRVDEISAAKAIADKHGGTLEERQKVFENAHADLLVWKRRALDAEAKLADIEALLKQPRK